MTGDAWIASREARRKQSSVPGAVVVIGLSVALGLKSGAIVGLLVLGASIVAVVGVALALLAHGRLATRSARRSGRPPFATAGLIAPMIARRSPSVLRKPRRAQSGQQPLRTGRLTVHPDRLEWQIRDSLARAFTPPLAPVVWHGGDIASCTFQDSGGLYPATYLTIVDGVSGTTMLVFDCAKIRSDIERMSTPERVATLR
jgi:hypothetical protein